MTLQNNFFKQVLKTNQEFENLKKSSKHVSAKAPQISKNVPTLFFSAVFKMSKHDNLLYCTEALKKKNSHGLNYCTEALKKNSQGFLFILQSPPFCAFLTQWSWGGHGWTKCHGRTCPVRGVKVIRAILQCHWTHTCDYFGALGTKVLVMGRICSYKNKLLFWASCLDIS